MDDLNPQQIEELRRSLERIGLSADQVDAALRAMDKAAKEAGRSLASVIKNLSKMDKEIITNKATLGSLTKDLLLNRRSVKDFSNDLELLDEKINELKDSTETSDKVIRGELIQRREAIQRLTQENALRKASIDGLTKFSKDVTSAGGRTASGLLRNMQENASAFTMAGGVIEGMVDGANAGMQTIGTGLTTVGTTLATNTNPRVRMLGMISAGAGIAIGKFSDAATAVTKVILNYMVKQMEMTVDAFNKTSSAGALFADGLTGMVNSATDAGLTVKQFGDVMKNNADLLAQSGLGVSEGAKRIGQVGKVMRESKITDSLLKLGYSFEEQSGLVAEVMADLRTANSSIMKDPAGVAKATEQYATNLRTIASITGEDAKKKMEETRKASANVAFRAKMMELEKEHPGIYQKTLAAMSTMTAEQQQNVRETVMFGGAINTTGAVMEGASSSLKEVTQETARSILNGTIDVKKNQELQAKGLKNFRENLDEVNAIGLAGMAGALPDVNSALSKILLASDRMTEEGVKASQEAAEKQKNATDKFTEDVVSAAKAAQALAVQLQDITLKELGNFAFYSRKIVEEIQSQLGKLGGSRSANVGPSKTEKYGRMALEYGGAALGGLLSGAGAAAATAGTGGAGALVAPAMLAAGISGGYMTGSTIADALFGAKKAELSDVIQFSGGTGDEAHFRQLDPRVQENFMAMAQEYSAANNGKKLQINSAFRTPAEQAATKSTYGPKAEPGKSLHQAGKALDLNSTDVTALAASGLLGKYGFKTISNDPPHIEAMAKGGITNGLSIAGEAGPEAVIPLPDGRNVPVKMDVGELIEKINEMIEVLKDGNRNTEKIYYASA